MYWDIQANLIYLNETLDWFKKQISHYDLSNLRSVYISKGKKKFYGVYGLCRYPDEKIAQYRISCYLPGPFPSTVLSEHKGIVYKDKVDGWPKHIKGLKQLSNGRIKINGIPTYWRRFSAYTSLNTHNEALIWILGHEFFHFLKHSKQIQGKNYEWQADRFADAMLESYRKYLTESAVIINI